MKLPFTKLFQQRSLWRGNLFQKRQQAKTQQKKILKKENDTNFLPKTTKKKTERAKREKGKRDALSVFVQFVSLWFSPFLETLRPILMAEYYRGEKRSESYYRNFKFNEHPGHSFDELEIQQSIRLTGHEPLYWKYEQIGRYHQKDQLRELTPEDIAECEKVTGKHPKYWFYSMGGFYSGYSPEEEADCLRYTGKTSQELHDQYVYNQTPLFHRRSWQIGLGIGALGLLTLAGLSPAGSVGTSMVFGAYFLNTAAISLIPSFLSFNVAKGGATEGGKVMRLFFPFHLAVNWYLLYQTMLTTYGDGPQQPLKLFFNQLANTTMWQVNAFSVLGMIIVGQSLRSN